METAKCARAVIAEGAANKVVMDRLDYLHRLAIGYARAYADTPSDLRVGLPAPDDENVKALLRHRAESKLHECASTARTLWQSVRDDIDAIDGTNPFTTHNRIEDATQRLSVLRDVIATAQSLATECAAAADIPSDDAVEALSEEIRARDTENRARLTMLTPADIVAHWRQGDDAARAFIPDEYGPAFRIVGTEIVSTLGARVSIDAGARLWRLIRAAVARGESRTWDWGKGPSVDAVRVQHIGADGSARVGCHDISSEETRAFAAYAGWPAIDVADDVDAA